ncbi:MAG: hypothetical protein WC543_00130 [Candidatus Omnitrophota bacterium]
MIREIEAMKKIAREMYQSNLNFKTRDILFALIQGNKLLKNPVSLQELYNVVGNVIEEN